MDMPPLEQLQWCKRQTCGEEEVENCSSIQGVFFFYSHRI